MSTEQREQQSDLRLPPKKLNGMNLSNNESNDSKKLKNSMYHIEDGHVGILIKSHEAIVNNRKNHVFMQTKNNTLVTKNEPTTPCSPLPSNRTVSKNETLNAPRTVSTPLRLHALTPNARPFSDATSPLLPSNKNNAHTAPVPLSLKRKSSTSIPTNFLPISPVSMEKTITSNVKPIPPVSPLVKQELERRKNVIKKSDNITIQDILKTETSIMCNVNVSSSTTKKDVPFQPKMRHSNPGFDINSFEHVIVPRGKTIIIRDELLRSIKQLFYSKSCYSDVIANITRQEQKDKMLIMREQHMKLLLMSPSQHQTQHSIDHHLIRNDDDNEQERIDKELNLLLGLLQKSRATLSHSFEMQHTLQAMEVMFVYKYRSCLYRERKLFVLVMTCITWNDPIGKKDGLALLKDLPNDLTTEDALELLYTLNHVSELRTACMTILERRPIQEVELFIPQILQASRYYDNKIVIKTLSNSSTSSPNSEAGDNLMTRFLTQCAARSSNIFNKLCWLLTVQCDCEPSNKLFKSMHYRLLTQQDVKSDLQLFLKQQKLISNLSNISSHLRSNLGNMSRSQRIQILESILDGTYANIRYQKESSSDQNGLRLFEWASVLPLESLPDSFMQLEIKSFKGLCGEQCGIFKSAMAPLAIPFIIDVDNSEHIYKVIFKQGDDLRQDVLMIQIMRFMDMVLRSHGMDLSLTIYNCVATGPQTGLVEMVTQSHTISSILDKHQGIYEFLAQHNPNRRDLQQALDRYVRSCAGYCVITYLLGVGDRHLDNLLLREDGSFFHIDFGFVLGRDPKPQFTTPPMRLTREMVDAMRDVDEPLRTDIQVDSAQFTRFKSLCCLAFSILRRYANIILLMLLLMSDSGLEQINRQNIRTVKQNFALHLTSDELTDQYILNKIEDSIKMILPNINEQIHKIAQSLRD